MANPNFEMARGAMRARGRTMKGEGMHRMPDGHMMADSEMKGMMAEYGRRGRRKAKKRYA